MEKRFEEIEHTADIAIRVWGRDLAEMFANAAYGMACQITEIEEIRPTIKRSVELEAADTEILLVSWLSELLYLGEKENCVFFEFDILTISSTELRAVARGGPITEHVTHIKAVTFSELEIISSDTGYETHVVFDV
jgi:SHS2 domain-containing protein